MLPDQFLRPELHVRRVAEMSGTVSYGGRGDERPPLWRKRLVPCVGGDAQVIYISLPLLSTLLETAVCEILNVERPLGRRFPT